MKRWQHFILLFLWVVLLALFFAKVEINIEGDAGWAASLPTWRIEDHWLLDIFWGGRPMTGYHFWIFTFMILAFHLPVLMVKRWSLRIEARIIACLELFWMVEDFLWFVLNPAYGISKFNPENISWHKNWFLFMPVDYWVFIVIMGFLFWFSFTKNTPVHNLFRRGKKNPLLP